MKEKIAIALLATTALATPAMASVCSGILHRDQTELSFGGSKGEGEGICIVNKSEQSKVLAVCSAGHYCKVMGQVDSCKDEGECVEISNISSVSPKK